MDPLARPERSYAVTAAAVVLVLATLHALVPSLRREIVVEGGFVEDATAVVWVGAALLAAVRLGRARSDVPAAAWTIPVVAILAALDEIGWGEHLLDLEMPVLAGVQIDALQDVPEALAVLLVRQGAVVAAAVAVCVVLVVLVLGIAFRRRITSVATTFWTFRPLRFVLLAIALGLAAVVADKAHAVYPRSIFVEEAVLEVSAALALVWAALLVPEPEPPETPAGES